MRKVIWHHTKSNSSDFLFRIRVWNIKTNFTIYPSKVKTIKHEKSNKQFIEFNSHESVLIYSQMAFQAAAEIKKSVRNNTSSIIHTKSIKLGCQV